MFLLKWLEPFEKEHSFSISLYLLASIGYGCLVSCLVLEIDRRLQLFLQKINAFTQVFWKILQKMMNKRRWSCHSSEYHQFSAGFFRNYLSDLTNTLKSGQNYVDKWWSLLCLTSMFLLIKRTMFINFLKRCQDYSY